ncbi:hypothetical protein B0T24DRAFT_624137 [Lasiosphaeria ovina]|uniref:Uncharacterized protein n=1 Tax=Lasiosphaeria ovina TaxID=92902 RepID=A0AAE0N867_9PEZI|nr:hypothetical protein B0T24DRAFT_624137 [Lasiosphaeria ovina]
MLIVRRASSGSFRLWPELAGVPGLRSTFLFLVSVMSLVWRVGAETEAEVGARCGFGPNSREVTIPRLDAARDQGSIRESKSAKRNTTFILSPGPNPETGRRSSRPPLEWNAPVLLCTPLLRLAALMQPPPGAAIKPLLAQFETARNAVIPIVTPYTTWKPPSMHVHENRSMTWPTCLGHFLETAYPGQQL